MCIICGYMGCGRNQSGHSKSHFLETSHIYSLDISKEKFKIESKRIWDYSNDKYVHRLIECNGKMVEIMNPNGCDVEGDVILD